jgi:DNA-binding transcriptional LysR family regulator
MNLTPAAIHKQLKQLEDELQTPLYEKRDGMLQPTAAAEVLLPYFRNILSEFKGSMSALEEWKGVKRGLLRIGAGPSLATYLLPPVFKNFHHQWPGIDADIQTGNSSQLIASLENGEIDLALIVARESSEDASITTVLELRFEIALVTCLAEIPQKCSLLDLALFSFLLFRRGARIENFIDEYLGTYHISPNVIMRFDSAEALKATLMSGTGVSMLPSYVVAQEIASGALRQIQQTEPPLTMSVRILRRSGGFVSPAVQAFISTFRETTGTASKGKNRGKLPQLESKKPKSEA